MVLYQSLVGKAFQQVLRFGMGKQFSPLLPRFQFSQQEPGEPLLFPLQEARRLSQRPLEEVGSSAFLRLQMRPRVNYLSALPVVNPLEEHPAILLSGPVPAPCSRLDVRRRQRTTGVQPTSSAWRTIGMWTVQASVMWNALISPPSLAGITTGRAENVGLEVPVDLHSRLNKGSEGITHEDLCMVSRLGKAQYLLASKVKSAHSMALSHLGDRQAEILGCSSSWRTVPRPYRLSRPI